MLSTQPSSLLLLLLCFGYATTLASANLKWATCPDISVKNPLPYDCANLTVPLDHTEPSSNGNLVLRLLRIPAAIMHAKGSILVNFGGPGEVGRTTLLAGSPLIQIYAKFLPSHLLPD